MPICCRAENGFPTEDYRKAGYWGEYSCDIPSSVLEHMLEFIKKEIKPELIFWTGDNSPHNVWANSVGEVSNSTIWITQTI